VFAYYYFDVGNIQAAHGRASAVATAVKRALPHSIVISYQGDGDLAAIGGNEILHAANRGENITVIFVNNAIYGMTGGQMAPTTLLGQKTTTTPTGRALENEGYPLRVCELLASLAGPTYIERVALFDNKSRMKARKAIRKAIQTQIEGKGFSLVEVLSPCPTGWGLLPAEACEWVEKDMTEYFPLQVFKDETATRQAMIKHKPTVPLEEIPAILGLNDERRTQSDEQIRKKFFNSSFSILNSSLEYMPPPVALRYRDPQIKIAGFGGQGVLFLGTILAESGMRQGYHVSWLPSYGPEMRGGTAHCHVTISTRPIGSPLISHPTVLISMNRPSLERFEPEAISGGLIIYNSSLINTTPTRSDVEIIALPATEIADELGSAKAANMVALGAYIGRTNLLDEELVVRALDGIVKNRSLLELNIKAIRAGIEFAQAEVTHGGQTEKTREYEFC
jgi:2-oxoisovalerate ferredoxin oxidoreductase beta subunit